MSDFEVKIICDSIDEKENRLTTFEVKYPFIIHAEIMTHRVFSRNFSSNRAIPTNKILDEEVYYPKDVRLNQSGMQGYKNADESLLTKFYSSIKYTYDVISNEFEQYNKVLHKQHVNRYFQPYNYMYGIISATSFDNFFNLRISDKAQPEIKILAELMKEELNKSKPVLKYLYDWHIPYLLESEINLPLRTKLLISTARCARVSYIKHGTDKIDIEEDIKLGNNLFNDKHLSPFEHCAMNGLNKLYANYKGWIQFRRFLELNMDFNDVKILEKWENNF